ncbi:MAG: hypothetical protein QOJ57_278 [Thermoleophilaceae bacterium]|jgi:hypothetical protein|nr:hypothetical protein [Thermoleophilaceae bacterium]
MKKELRPIHDDVSCDICGRTILKGERTEPYLAPGGQRHLVCELCTDRAYNEGWIRESAHMDMPASTRRPQERRSLFGRMRRRRDAEPLQQPIAEEPPVFAEDLGGGNGGDPGYGAPVLDAEPSAEPPPPPPPAPTPAPPRRRDARHVRAVPTNAQVKVERALELFNNSEHVRTIGGIARTLGEPWVSASPLHEAPSEVSIVVAWELSWYRYRVDLGDADDPVTLLAKGQELDELDESMRDWNATALADGKLAVGVAS